MRVMIIGSGGREHALAWKVAQSPRLSELFIAPGNPGTAALGTNLPIPVGDIDALLAAAREHAIDLTLVGPEDPLVAGIVDAFQAAGLRAWGPSKAAAELEGSKVAMKEFLRRHNIPTASFRMFDDAEQADAYIDEIGAPIVVKCDGLAAGKGVTVAGDVDEAHAAVDRIMRQQVFGAAAGRQVVVEQCLKGEEISVFAFCDGHNALLLDYAQDHKQAYDGDAGPNTGGMGAFTPAPGLVDRRSEDDIVRRILFPTLSGLVQEERPYVGILYMGLMLTDGGPKVIEYNVRFGDPECQPLMLRLENDLLDICEACLDGTLDKHELSWRPETAVCLTLASPGYPGSYPKGKAITGLDDAAVGAGITVFHAGTKKDKSGDLVTSGGRVLCVCAMGKDLKEARRRAYEAAGQIDFAEVGVMLRSDIGRRHG